MNSYKNTIAILVNSMTNGGAERVVLTLAKELRMRSCDVEIILLEKDNFYEIPEYFKVTYLSNANGLENGFMKFLSLFVLPFRLAKIIRLKNIRLVQSHMYRANFVNILAKYLGGNHKTQLVNHSMISYNKGRGLHGVVKLGLVRLLYRHADQCILVSKAMQQDLSIYSPNTNSTVINNPFDLNKIEELSNMKSFETDFVFSKHKKYLICAGRFIKIKNFDVVIKSLNFLEDTVELILLGDGEEKESLMKLSYELGLRDRVHFLGNIKNPFQLIKKADILILSSKTEGFPMVLIEAMVCEVPIISTHCVSGPSEIFNLDEFEWEESGIKKTEYGILTKIGDPACLSEAIVQLLSDPVLSAKYRYNGRVRMNDYSKEAIVSKYIDSFKLME